jgi:hypothetical protein
MAVYSEGTMAPEARRFLPDLGIERALGPRDGQAIFRRFQIMKLGTQLLEVDLALMRAERGPHDPTERDLQELRASAPSRELVDLGLQVGRPVVAVR